MLIDQCAPDFQEELERHYDTLPQGTRLALLVDGAFCPGIFTEVINHDSIFLFESLPGFSKATKDVSPFLFQYHPADRSITRLLKRCNGWPMLSAISTPEPLLKLASRLAAWCVVEADGQRFNFRFPDTRRLPAIFNELDNAQGAEMTGEATDWRYVHRDGSWQSLQLKPFLSNAATTQSAKLSGQQFSNLVQDSEADEIWVRLLDRGATTILRPSERHAQLSNALRIAHQASLSDFLKIRWCSECISDPCAIQVDPLLLKFSQWHKKYAELS